MGSYHQRQHHLGYLHLSALRGYRSYFYQCLRRTVQLGTFSQHTSGERVRGEWGQALLSLMPGDDGHDVSDASDDIRHHHENLQRAPFRVAAN